MEDLVGALSLTDMIMIISECCVLYVFNYHGVCASVACIIQQSYAHV